MTSAARLVIEPAGPGRAAASPGYYATILVSNEEHLYSVQWAAREICRTLGYAEADAARAASQVADFTRKSLLEPSRSGKLHLTAVEAGGRLALEARAEFESVPSRA